MRKVITAIVVCIISLQANILKVPADHATIQSAINASSKGDSVVVFPGTYYENVRFNGKSIVLTSRFYESHDLSFVYSTVINGSQPQYQDSASCIRIIDGEDSTTIVQGFTITGGKGTAWPDEHSPGTYIEGGGILTAFTSPVIQNNLIIQNDAYSGHAGITSAGGGGIRSGDGNPKILYNVIMFNRGFYGGGIVLNYCGATVRNNLIVGNTGGEGYGGGGIWLNGSNAKPKIIENNTIVSNQSRLPGGGILTYDGSGSINIRNNIVWGNFAPSEASISLTITSGTKIEYNDVQDGFSGTGNINIDPMLADTGFILMPASQLIDHGDSSNIFNDPNNGTNAIFPSRGTKRNDIGAYGGPMASILPVSSLPKINLSTQIIGFGKIQPDSLVKVTLTIRNLGVAILKIDSITIHQNSENSLSIIKAPNNTITTIGIDTVTLQWNPTTVQQLFDTLLIYHNDPSTTSPLKISLNGNAFKIEKAVEGIMYAGSGTSDSAKFYTVDSDNGTLSFKGKTGFSQLLSLRRNPKTNELIGLVNSSSSKLNRISSGSGESLLLSSVSVPNPKGMVFRSDGSLLIGAFNGSIYSVNVNTGASSVVVSTGLKIAGLAFNPLDGTLWASVRPISSGKDNIYTVNLSTGASTLIGNTGLGIATKDITFDAAGNLFGVIDTSGSQSYLIQINKTTGQGTVIGGMGAKGIETIELSSNYITGVEGSSENVPNTFKLSQNFPNPFNPITTIQYQLPVRGFVSLKIYDLLGREAALIVRGEQSAGTYTITFNGSTLSSSVYFYRLEAGDFVETKRMILLK